MSSLSPYRISQRCPPDRRNARRATIVETREQYAWPSDDLQGDPAEGFRLPDHIAALPKDENFSTQKLVELFGHKFQGQLNAKLSPGRIRHLDDYGRMFTLVPKPSSAARWDRDVEFARQRLAGVNPMLLRAVDASPSKALADAADRTLRERGDSLAKALDRGAVFETDCGVLREECIQRHVRRFQRHLAAPRSLFVVGEDRVLRPVAIQLWPDDQPGPNPAYGPHDDPWAWRLARWHAQCADATMHEGLFHLFETHLVSEVVAVALARTLHPTHPVFQLLKEHFSFNLAIDVLARSDMLAPGLAIDMALSAGSAGAINAMRLWFNHGWSWQERSLAKDLAKRGVADPARLPGYHYRDDALPVRDAIGHYSRDTMADFYDDDDAVAGDFELQDWARETSSKLPGFPVKFETGAALFETLAEVIFRASAQHSAVNNGQFEAYGYIPNAPGLLLTAPPTQSSYTEGEALAALPKGPGIYAQVTMAWVLSEPTHYGIMGLGNVPAFDAAYSPAARQAVAAARRRFAACAGAVAARNADLEVPYTYLDPRNIELSSGT